MMRSRVHSIAFLVGLVAVLPAVADETPIDIQTDLEGDYFIVEKMGTQNKPVVLVKQVGPRVTYYIKREYDCEAHSVRYLGEGESLEAVAESQPERDMRAISEGSISDQLAKYVCPEPEAPTEAPNE